MRFYDFVSQYFSKFTGLCFFFLYLPCAQAQWHGDLKLLSDYVYRGYSKSRDNPIAQGHVDYQDDAGWFAGLDLSQVGFDDRRNADRAEIEIKPYLGWSLPISADWRSELSVSAYIYDNKVFNHAADYAELYASLHYRDWLSARASIAPNAYQRQVNVAIVHNAHSKLMSFHSAFASSPGGTNTNGISFNADRKINEPL